MNSEKSKDRAKESGDEELLYRNNRELFYSFDPEKGYGTKVGYQNSANQEIIRQSWEAAELRLSGIRDQVRAGILSPVAYHMERCLMEVPMLAGYMGLPKWRVKRHLRSTVYKRLPDNLRLRYARVFGIDVQVLDNTDIPFNNSNSQA